MSFPEYKRCSGCGEVKPLDQFYRCANGKYGRQSRCKPCGKLAKKNWESKNLSKHRASMRLRANRRVRGKKSPEQNRAHMAVHHAIRRGELSRPDSCERCGSTPPKSIDGRALIHAHHRDYSKPLDVEWLCVSCHKSLHATEQANGPQKLGDLVQLESGEEAA